MIGWSTDGYYIPPYDTSLPTRVVAPRVSHKPSYYIDPSAVPKTVRRSGTIIRRVEDGRWNH